MNTEVEILDDWAAVVAARWSEQLRPGLRMCLPTGSTPRPVYQRMTTGFAGTTVLVLDEYGGLDPGDPASCGAMIDNDLVSHLDVRPHVDALDTRADDLAAECRRFSRLAGDGPDLTLLGLGRNGHLGLNEPGSRADSVTRVVTLAEETRDGVRGYGVDPPPTWGMTLGLAEILRSKRIWLLVTGAHKADILRRTLEGTIGADVPASFLRTHSNTVVLADREAAADLGR